MSHIRLMMLNGCCILLMCFHCFSFVLAKGNHSLNRTILHYHPEPEAVVADVQRRINESMARKQLLSVQQCHNGNPIDDCWRCDPNWATTNRQRLADCSIGFGIGARGGKGGRIYVVRDSSDNDPANPKPGTLRYGVIQDEPLWIVFSASMTIVLRHELIFNSYKTVDGRGVEVYITGHGCLTLQFITHVIIHGVHVYGCKPSGNTNIASTPTHVGRRGRSDGDGISIFGSQQVWIDHCTLSQCTDGLIDIIMGSTAITISNNYFSHHDEVMLMGHDDGHSPDSHMQVTIAFNFFGKELIQRMPRCRRGYFHIVNNDYTSWEMYAIGGSANPTINSQGNRYVAPTDPDAKEVTKRVDTAEMVWASWNWRTEGDVMYNGAFFVPSGSGLRAKYAEATSIDAESAELVSQITTNAGVLGAASDVGQGDSNPGLTNSGGSFVTGRGGDSGGDPFGMIFGSGAPSNPSFNYITIFLITYFVFCGIQTFLH